MHEVKPIAVLESRLCLKCNNLCTCTSVNGVLAGLQCKILSRLKKTRPLFLECARSPLRTPRKHTKIQILAYRLASRFLKINNFNFHLEKIVNTCALYGIC